MPRIPYKNPAKGASPIGDAIRERRGARGLTPLDQALLNAPEIAVRPLLSPRTARANSSTATDHGPPQSGWNSLLGAVRNRNSLPDDIRELMVRAPTPLSKPEA